MPLFVVVFCPVEAAFGLLAVCGIRSEERVFIDDMIRRKDLQKPLEKPLEKYGQRGSDIYDQKM